MISLRLVQLIECHSAELATELVAKLENSSRTPELHKIPADRALCFGTEAYEQYIQQQVTGSAGSSPTEDKHGTDTALNASMTRAVSSVRMRALFLTVG